MTRARLALCLATTAVLVSACSRKNPTPAAATTIGFTIDASRVEGGPFYVMLNSASDQPGWVSVTGPGGRAYFRERCDISDCGAPAAVCGASIPIIQNIGPGAANRSVTTTWDKTTSVVDAALQCERRQPAEPGAYIARFCYSREAEMTDGKPTMIVRPTCVERPFTLNDRQVTLTP
jgi:hypothetical protein